MKRRTLGTSDVDVSAIGLGCMGMSQSYGPGDEEESIKTLNRALERFSDSLGSDWARDERRERRGEVRRERVVDTAIECLQRFSPAECRNCFRHCGYSIATQS